MFFCSIIMPLTLDHKKTLFFKTLIFPLLSGVVYGISWSYDGLSFLQLISLVPLFIALYTVREADNSLKKKLRQLVLISFLFKAPIVLITLPWLYELSATALFILIITETIMFLMVFSVILIRKIPFFAIICLYVLYELLMQNVTILVPFYQLGYAWGNHIQWIQYYSLLGIEGGTLVLLLVNYAFFKWYKIKKIQWSSILLFSVFISLSLFSILKFHFSEDMKVDESSSISIIHSNFISENEIYRQNAIALIDSINSITNPNTLVVFPEVFFNSFSWFENLHTNPNVKYINALQKENNQVYFIGAYLNSLTDNPTPQSSYSKDYDIYYNTHNTSILIGDNITRVKSKRRFIPFYEYIPDNSIAQWINKHIAEIGDERKATILNKNDRFSYKGKRFNSLLCYESVFPLTFAKHAKHNQFLIIQTNESWNKSEILTKDYLKLNRVNAIQIGIPVYRSSNYGYSAIIYPNGTAELQTDTKDSFTVLEGYLPQNIKNSFYCHIVGYSYRASALVLLFLFIKGVRTTFFNKKVIRKK